MTIEMVDFQPILHQEVTQLIETWKSNGFSEDEVQDCASQIFNLGLIASQQIQQEVGIQSEGMPTRIDYTEELATSILHLFLKSLNVAVLKAKSHQIPQTIKWQLIQNVAFHAFEQSKQAAIATWGEESTPDVTLNSDQLSGWLEQTSVEAFLYYLGEYEKQNGPVSNEENEVDPLLAQPLPVVLPQETLAAMAQEAVELAPVSAEEPLVQSKLVPEAIPVQDDLHHKYAAVALLLNTLPASRIQGILTAFNDTEKLIIQGYKDPNVISQTLNLARVAEYVRSFKTLIAQGKTPKKKSQFATQLKQLLPLLPQSRLQQLLEPERPLVRNYLQQYSQRDYEQFEALKIPPGLEESMLNYLKRNFPQEASRV
jgi:hypothetical protein